MCVYLVNTRKHPYELSYAARPKGDRLIAKMREKNNMNQIIFPFLSFAQHHINNALNASGRLGKVSSVLSHRPIGLLLNKNPCLNHLIHEERGN